MSGSVAFYLDLDDGSDPGPAQARYLDGVVREARRDNPIHRSFAVRFQYDLDGASHWNGELFVLEIWAGGCMIRYAYADERMRQEVLAGKRSLPPEVPGRAFSVEIKTSWSELRGEDLKEALDLFRIDAVMDC